MRFRAAGRQFAKTGTGFRRCMENDDPEEFPKQVRCRRGYPLRHHVDAAPVWNQQILDGRFQASGTFSKSAGLSGQGGYAAASGVTGVSQWTR